MQEELGDQGFRVVAVAQDTGGWEHARAFVDEAGATFTALVDPTHVVSALYGMVNVPTGVWIDEEGRIVRPPETAWTRHYDFGGLIEVDGGPYVAALRDWVRNGEASRYALSEDEVRARLAASDPDRLRSAAHAQLAAHLQSQGSSEAAAAHWEEAQRLDPDYWNVHRQQWTFDPETRGAKWRAKFDALAGRPYYEPVDLGGK